MQDVKDSLVHPVKMSLRIRACIRIALAVFQRAELFLRRDRHRSKDQSLSPEDPECFLSDRPRYRLCGQIKQLIAFSLPDRADRREHRGERLSDPGRCLDEQPLFPADRAVDRHHKVSLSLPVRVWEFQIPDRCVASQLMVVEISRPFKIFMDHARKPLFQFFL